MRSPARIGAKGKRPRLQLIGPGQFRELRLSFGWSVERVAELLKVTDRTVRNWESGTARCPYAAFKLLRIIGGRKLLGAAFGDAYVVDDVLVTTEGHKFAAADLGWWSLVVRQAQAWRELVAKEHGREALPATTSLARHCKAPTGVVGSKRAPAAGSGAVKHQSDTRVTPHGGTFPRSLPWITPQDRTSSPVGPESNTGQKAAQNPRKVAA
ncbi:VC1465 family Xer recombination activation factor [Lysobacter sp. F6437]